MTSRISRLSLASFIAIATSSAFFHSQESKAFDAVAASQGERFVQNLPSDWRSSIGEWKYFDVVNCFTTPGAVCYGSNPTSPYAFPVFPSEDTGLPVKSFQLNANESVVIFFNDSTDAVFCLYTVSV